MSIIYVSIVDIEIIKYKKKNYNKIFNIFKYKL